MPRRDYVCQIRDPILSVEARERIGTLFLENKSPLEDVKTKAGAAGGLYDFSAGLMCIQDELQELQARILIPFTAGIILIKPNTWITRHIDTRKYKRECSIVVPLYPRTKYAPTFFWESHEASAPACTVTRDDLPCLFNLQKLHSVSNLEVHRLNFQISFALQYDEVRNLYEAGALFRS